MIHDTHPAGQVEPAGRVSLRVIRGGMARAESPLLEAPSPRLRASERAHRVRMRDVLADGMPRRGLPDEVNDWRAENAYRLIGKATRLLTALRIGAATFTGELRLAHIDGATGERVDYGLASLKKVTNRGVEWITDAFQNLVELENMRYHGIGTGSTAEATGDTILVTELTTQYNPDNTRATGTLAENAVNVYRTVGTNTVDAAVAATEHGIFSQAATGAESATNRLLDRSVFSVINLASADGLESTYDFTTTAEA